MLNMAKQFKKKYIIKYKIYLPFQLTEKEHVKAVVSMNENYELIMANGQKVCITLEL